MIKDILISVQDVNTLIYLWETYSQQPNDATLKAFEAQYKQITGQSWLNHLEVLYV